jgi:hypothetical protein
VRGYGCTSNAPTSHKQIGDPRSDLKAAVREKKNPAEAGSLGCCCLRLKAANQRDPVVHGTDAAAVLLVAFTQSLGFDDLAA